MSTDFVTQLNIMRLERNLDECARTNKKLIRLNELLLSSIKKVAELPPDEVGILVEWTKLEYEKIQKEEVVDEPDTLR